MIFSKFRERVQSPILAVRPKREIENDMAPKETLQKWIEGFNKANLEKTRTYHLKSKYGWQVCAKLLLLKYHDKANLT